MNTLAFLQTCLVRTTTTLIFLQVLCLFQVMVSKLQGKYALEFGPHYFLDRHRKSSSMAPHCIESTAVLLYKIGAFLCMEGALIYKVSTLLFKSGALLCKVDTFLCKVVDLPYNVGVFLCKVGDLSSSMCHVGEVSVNH